MSGGASGVAIGLLLAMACVSDLRTRRIPNSLVLITALAGIAFAVAAKPFTAGLIQALGGMATGLAIWLPFYLFGMLGAGDVKLFAAAATFLGARTAVEAALYTAIFGGVMAAGFMVFSSGWSSTFIRMGHAIHQPGLLRNPTVERGRRMPYALAIAAGVIGSVCWPGRLLG